MEVEPQEQESTVEPTVESAAEPAVEESAEPTVEESVDAMEVEPEQPVQQPAATECVEVTAEVGRLYTLTHCASHTHTPHTIH